MQLVTVMLMSCIFHYLWRFGCLTKLVALSRENVCARGQADLITQLYLTYVVLLIDSGGSDPVGRENDSSNGRRAIELARVCP
jgi:hypothetical protein